MRIGRTKAVMPRIAAAALHLAIHRRKVELVVEDRHVLLRQLVEAHRFPHRSAAFVHEGRGLQKDDPLRPDPPFLPQADRTSTRLNSSHSYASHMTYSAS